MTTLGVLLQAPGGGSMNTFLIFMVLMFAVMYFFMIRPQQKKQKEQKGFLEELKKGDKVVTMGGIHGKIAQSNPESSTILLEIAEGTKIKIDKSVISLEYSLLANNPNQETK